MEETKGLDAFDYLAASQYAWVAYNQRRLDLMMGKGKDKDPFASQNTINWENLNPVYQELQHQKREKIPPPKFLNSIKPFTKSEV